MIALFARANHPEGYGSHSGTAHGYVVLCVRCKSRKQVSEVTARLNKYNAPFHGIKTPDASGWSNQGTGNLGEWYGGMFDLLAVIPGNKVEYVWQGQGDLIPANARFISKGDNRFVGTYEAEEVLAS